MSASLASTSGFKAKSSFNWAWAWASWGGLILSPLEPRLDGMEGVDGQFGLPGQRHKRVVGGDIVKGVGYRDGQVGKSEGLKGKGEKDNENNGFYPVQLHGAYLLKLMEQNGRGLQNKCQ
jgi:hypothetical protein